MRVWYRLLSVFLLLFSGLTEQLYSSDQSELRMAFPELTFDRPVDLQNPGDGTNRIFIVTLIGAIYVFQNDPDVTETEVFLNIRDQVRSGGELGLLGLAFHPDYKTNGYFFVNYTANNPLRTVVSRFKVSEDNPNRADTDSEEIILEFNQPLSNHNGGQIAFGPDGYLYIATGDGGGGGDPGNNAQNRTNLLGAILRIDVDNNSEDRNYSIPDDNPFVGNTQGFREEIFAYGLRNPWRMSFDFETGWLWCGDVGQSGWEIIHIIENGGNYGWNIVEGSHCYPPGSDCDKTGLEMPVFEYTWGQDGRSITGGYVYRGSVFPELYGKYVYGDYMFGTIWALEYDGENPPINYKLIDTDLRISSFGVDEHGELYILDHASAGRIYTFDSLLSIERSETIPSEFRLHQNYPNPFNQGTRISFSLSTQEHVTIEVFNLIGQKVATVTDRQYDRGEYSIPWNPGTLGSSVYFYRMRAGDFVDIKRMVLLQ
jgi:glucose/arabinose dehydrogenase